MIESEKSKCSKVRRKQKRCQAIVSRDANIECVDYPTKYIAICNAGLSNGLQKEVILEAALHHAHISDVIMQPNKSYCFIECSNEYEATKVFESMHAKAKLGQNETMIYLSYVKSIPHVPNLWNQPAPDGLIILKDFVSEEEESILLKVLRLKDDLPENNLLKHRRVKHFGYEFLYGLNNVDHDKPLKEPIPEECDILYQRLEGQIATELALVPDQLTVNVYEPGQGIPPHVDTHSAFMDPIYSLSLESDIVMEFRRRDVDHVPVFVPKRSLLVMSGESRYAWTHGITPRQMDVVPSNEGGLTIKHRSRRTSLTFRKLRRKECDCTYREMCDTYAAKQKKNADRLASVAAKLEEENVHKVYDEIANHFSETRYKPWPKVENFLKSFALGSIILDVGCGNGKYLAINSNVVHIGCDRNEGLLQVCSQRKCNVFQCNCLSLPFRDNSMDGCISIAVIHHLATEDRRLQALREMARVLIPGGRCLIYVWAKNQEFNSEKSSYLHRNRNNRVLNTKTELKETEGLTQPIKLKSNLVDLPVHVNRTQFQEQDVFVPWKLKKGATEATQEKAETGGEEKKEFLRYYHVFDESELVKLCSLIDFIEVETCYYDQGNWCVIFKKNDFNGRLLQ